MRGHHELHPIFTILFFALWAAVMGPYLFFALYVVPRAIRRWEKAHGYRIIHREPKVVFKGPFSWESTNIQLTYRITVRDKADLVTQGWMRVGKPWSFALSVGGCPVEVRWDEADGPMYFRGRASAPQSEQALWDREVDR